MTVLDNENVLYMAMELGDKKWRLRFGDARKVRDKSVPAGDQVGLRRAIATAKERLGLREEAPVRSCYEAGRDGFWIHRFLAKEGIENLVVDPASIEVNRRERRAKTDRLDAEKLLVMLIRYWVYGEKTVWKVVHIPSERAESERRPHRELDGLTKERTAHSNRIRSLLVTQGIRIGNPLTHDLSALKDWEGKPLAAELLVELQRDQQRLKLLQEQIRGLERMKLKRLTHPETEADSKAQKLMQLRGVGPVSSWLLAKEFFAWRQFRNRRQVGALAGLTGTPYDSGGSVRDQGISKSGSRWVRKTAVELAWGWIRFQPHSSLTRWFYSRFGHGNKRLRRVGIVALGRKLLVALWRYVEFDEMPEGAALNLKRTCSG